MLKIIASIIAHPKYHHLLELEQDTLVVKNYHFFLWHVLPTITGKQINKPAFIKQMSLQGLQIHKQSASNEGRQSQKALRFKISTQSHINYLQTVQTISQQKERQKQKLDSKINYLSNQLLHIQPHSHNIMKELELIEEVSSLKEINRNMFRLNTQIYSLLSGSQEPKNLTNNEDTFDFLSEEVQPTKHHKFYSMQLLENCQ